MARLEELTRDTTVKGILRDMPITVIDVKWHGTNVIELTYKDPGGKLGNELVYRDREPELEIVKKGRRWNYTADASLFRLVSEAYRIRMAYLFDPYLAIHTSLVEPLPHQITAVYEKMLPRLPLRFLLADDPGAGKTIMAGLLIKELKARGDLERCLIISPGNLVDQWQDEMYRRFHLPFEVLTNDRLETARTGNAFQEMPLLIARLDKLSRNEDVQEKLAQTDWDLIVCDEAHKMSASYFGTEKKETKRYKLGKLASSLTRHFLLLTATPHNGKEEDFQLFMALLDGDRFEGRFRDGVHSVDTSDIMSRMVKEQLLKFDETPLFPERLAYTVTYRLSDSEAVLYEKVTGYVREEFNRVEALKNEKRKGTVGFALTILQRRLASSPEAIYQSIKRRKEKLEHRLREEKLLKRGYDAFIEDMDSLAGLTEEDIDDLEDAPDAEVEKFEEQFVDEATAARTIEELEAEIAILDGLETLANTVRRSGSDKKWEELSKLLQDSPEMFDREGYRRKLIIFSEHRDTLNYLVARIRTLFGRPESVVVIHGGMGREQRKKAQELFKQDKDVKVLVATDAAGEGINLQRAHLMVNYDLPWNPNRIEQRFGRIHRIGQNEVCHLWNLVAEETREGDVYLTLLKKLDVERRSLGGAVFDVLGKAVGSKDLRGLMIDAIRYGNRPDVKARLFKKVENALDHDRLKELIEERMLVHDSMDTTRVRKIKENMERAAARRLQPHFIESFFISAFKKLGGSIQEREPNRYEVRRVPASIKNRDRIIVRGEVVTDRYERICFEKDLISLPGKPLASFVCPGHPLLDSTIDIVLERYRALLKEGAIFLDESDTGEKISALNYLEHSLQDGRTDMHGNRRIVSKQMQFVVIDGEGVMKNAGYAPYLDYRPLTEEELELVRPHLEKGWLEKDFESRVNEYAAAHLVPRHYNEVKARREEIINKTMFAVNDRLLKEINYWDHRTEELKAEERAGKTNARMNAAKARAQADKLEERLGKRHIELEQERQIAPLPPVILGGALVIPAGLMARLRGYREKHTDSFARETARIERIAMEEVMKKEKSLGFIPKDVSGENCGYDIESAVPGSGRLRFIEVKGRAAGAKIITVTKNEILTSLNKPDDYILAVVEIFDDSCVVNYIKRPFKKEPDFGVTSVNYNIEKLVTKAE